MARHLVIPGGSGFLGRTLAAHFSGRGDRVTVLARQPVVVPGAETVLWDGCRLSGWASTLDGADAVINLAGRSVNCRYHARNRLEMINSRVESTAILGEAISCCSRPPKVWLNSSTATIYRHADPQRGDPAHTEAEGRYGADFRAKDPFSLGVAHAWEAAFAEAYRRFPLASTRPVLLRTAMVFGAEPGGVWETLARLVRGGLGGTMGPGDQFVSWIHAVDFAGAVNWLVEDQPQRSGVYNLAAPQPLPNAEMMAILRRELRVPFGLPAAAWMLEIGAWGLRTETELILKSRRVIPQRLEQEGFRFQFPDFAAAARDLAKTAAGSRR